MAQTVADRLVQSLEQWDVKRIYERPVVIDAVTDPSAPPLPPTSTTSRPGR